MSTLSEIREQVRIEAGEASGGESWSDAELDRHVTRALEELSAAWPREESAALETAVGSRDLSLATPGPSLIEVESVEYPVDTYPPSWVGFSTWNGTLTLHSETAPNGGEARIYYTARHTLDGSGTTLTPFQEELVIAGAAAYAAMERSASLANRLATDSQASAQLAAYARARLTAFRQLLQQYGRKQRVRGRRLYVPA